MAGALAPSYILKENIKHSQLKRVGGEWGSSKGIKTQNPTKIIQM